jgi:hypothetical protein
MAARPPTAREAAMLARLAALAGLKREAEMARLSRIAQSRNRLLAAVEALRQAEAPLDPPGSVTDPVMVGVRLAHLRWSEGQQRRLNQQLAMVTADWLRQKPAAARAFGRASVLETLAEQAAEQRKP